MINKYLDVKKGSVERIYTPWYSAADGNTEFVSAPVYSIYDPSDVVLDDFDSLDIAEYSAAGSSVRAILILDTSDAAFVIGSTYKVVITSSLSEDGEGTTYTDVYTVLVRIISPLL